MNAKFRTLVIAAAICAVGCAGPGRGVRQDAGDLYLRAPAAGSVSLVITGDRFRQIRAVRVDQDTWRVRLGRAEGFTYFLLVDGQAFLPDCRLKEKDDFGSENCVFVPREGREELRTR